VRARVDGCVGVWMGVWMGAHARVLRETS